MDSSSEQDLGMMMGEPVTKETSSPAGALPTVLENEVQPNNNLLTPPRTSLSPDLHKVASANSIKLMGVPVTTNDPLGALVDSSPTMQKSATASELLQGKRKSLQDNILGSPFSSSTTEMSRSSTMPLTTDNDDMDQQNKSYFSMASIKNMTKSGTSKLTNFKKTAYFSSSAWMSPNSKESLNKGFSSLRSAYSSATSTISKRVEELREQQVTPSKIQAASSNPNLMNIKDQDEDTLSTNSETQRLQRPSEYGDQPDSWSNFTGQIWDQLWSYSYEKYMAQQQPSSNLNQGPQSLKSFYDLFEELYERMPSDIAAPTAMILAMTSCSQCKTCGSILYDEEIIAGWTAEDSNLNTRCPFCMKMMVPFLTIEVTDHRCQPMKITNGNVQVEKQERVQVPYLSPIVLRKELESILEREGDACLGDAECVNDHPIIYWNLLWFFERIGVSSHLAGLCLKASSLNKVDHDESWKDADHRNVSVKLHWDNVMFFEESGSPMYVQMDLENGGTDKNPIISMICDGVQNKDLLGPLKNLLDAREEEAEQEPKSNHRSIYREMMFVTLRSFGQTNIDLTAFDREFRRAVDRLPPDYQSLMTPSDRPPNNMTVICRKFFRELKI